jgi:hypothetical protein
MPFVSPLNTTDMAQPTFHATMTVAQFKSAKNTDTLQIIKNPNTGKLFMADDAGNVLGAVAPTYKDGTPVVSEVSGDDGNLFFLLHKKGESNAPQDIL